MADLLVALSHARDPVSVDALATEAWELVAGSYGFPLVGDPTFAAQRLRGRGIGSGGEHADLSFHRRPSALGCRRWPVLLARGHARHNPPAEG